MAEIWGALPQAQAPCSVPLRPAEAEKPSGKDSHPGPRREECEDPLRQSADYAFPEDDRGHHAHRDGHAEPRRRTAESSPLW
jgi:hypothetical protein